MLKRSKILVWILLLFRYDVVLNFYPSGTVLKQSDGTVILMTLHQQFVRDFCVPFGHLQIGVSHLPLKREQIATVFQIEGGKAMAYLIRGELHASTLAVFSEVPSQHIGF